MKKFFTLAMALFSMAAVMTSCGGDDDPEDITPVVPEPEYTYTMAFTLAVTDVQLEMMNMSINYTIDGQTATITPNMMKEIPLVKDLADLDKAAHGQGKTKLLSYDVPAEFTKAQLENGTRECVVKRIDEGIAKYRNELVKIGVGFNTIIYANGDQMPHKYTYNVMGEVSLKEDSNVDYLIETLNIEYAKTSF